MKPSSLVGHIVEVLLSISSSPYPADAVIGTFFRQRKYLGSRDRKFISETVYGVLRHRRLCEHLLSETENVLDGVTSEGKTLLEAAAYLLGVQPSGDVDVTDILEMLGEGEDTSRFRSALETLRSRGPVRTDGLEAGVRWSFPDWMVRRFGQEYGAEQLPALLEASNLPAPLSIRVNTLKATPEECAHRLKQDGIVSHRHPVLSGALRLEKRMNAFSLDAFRDGWFEVQDEGSQLLARLADPKPTFRVLDMCAGAGGKTLALSAIMKNRGEIVATDVSSFRLKELRKRMRRAGAGNIRVQDGLLEEKHRAQFDLVFVDAPCTGVGTIRRNPGMKWTVTEAMVTELSVKQGDILRRAATFVRPGGLLLYATCSLFREENEAVVEHFLSVAGEFSVEDAGARLAGIGVKDASAGPYVKLMPHIHETDGFFCAFLRRTLDTGGDPPGQGSSQLPAS